MFPIAIGDQYVRGEMPVARIDPLDGPFTQLAAARIQLVPQTGLEAQVYGESEVLLTAVAGEVEVATPDRGEVPLVPGVCVMLPRGEPFTLDNRSTATATLLAVLTRSDLVDTLPRTHLGECHDRHDHARSPRGLHAAA
ncbi:hypothetical protein ACIQM4_25745 [Streptomyces sp. NPDC091272]|uniref:hypothetical protein n=1 Tax=Streptomyces sp. NPDC091272 TaxID=3365981 RepID=UPI0037FAE113